MVIQLADLDADSFSCDLLQVCEDYACFQDRLKRYPCLDSKLIRLIQTVSSGERFTVLNFAAIDCYTITIVPIEQIEVTASIAFRQNLDMIASLLQNLDDLTGC